MREKVLIGTYQHAALVTALPASPEDGDEIIFTDSLTAPTYQWLLRYVAAKSTNKWVCIGGAPAYSEVVTNEATATTLGAYVALATAGPSIAIPVAGTYQVEIGGTGRNVSSQSVSLMSYDIGGTGASDDDSFSMLSVAGAICAGSRKRSKALTALTLTAKYKSTGAHGNWEKRWMSVLPVAVGG